MIFNFSSVQGGSGGVVQVLRDGTTLEASAAVEAQSTG